MKKVSFLMLLALCIWLASGCSEKAASSVSNPAENKGAAVTAPVQAGEPAGQTQPDVPKPASLDYTSYTGDWSLKVSTDEDLYRMTALATYYGATGIHIEKIQNGRLKGSMYSISGAPSFRQANVVFEGDIVDGKLTAPYTDEGWLYSGEILLTFEKDRIDADITRKKTETPAMWGIPEGQFTFLRPIETETVKLSDEKNAQLTQFLSAVTKDRIKPFEEGALSDEMIIDFVGLNLGLGAMDVSEFGDKIKSGAEIVFDESVLNRLSSRYFGAEVKKHGSTEIVQYDNGVYRVPALGGVSEYPVLQMLMKDTKEEGIYYAIVDFLLDTPEKTAPFAYQYLIKLQIDDGYIIKSITEVKSPIDFSLFTPEP